MRGGSHQGGVRAWHTACCKKQCPIPAARTKKIKGNLDDLCQRPGEQPGDQDSILKERPRTHSDSSSNGITASPTTCLTLSSAASRSAPQRDAKACPRSNSLIASSSWFCSPSSVETISSSSTSASSYDN